MVLFKQKCAVCKKNYVLVSGRRNYAVCYDCQKHELNKEIKDKKMKELFDIPEEFYKENAFLRNIKINYIKYKNLTDKQIAAFKKVVKAMREK